MTVWQASSVQTTKARRDLMPEETQGPGIAMRTAICKACMIGSLSSGFMPRFRYLSMVIREGIT